MPDAKISGRDLKFAHCMLVLLHAPVDVVRRHANGVSA